jgi:carboxylesterase family protein
VKLRLGELTFDADARQLLRSGAEIHLSPKAFDLLKILVQHRPRVLSKNELHEHLWPSTFVSETNLPRPPALFEQINETGRAQWTPVVEGYEIPDQPRRLYRRGAFTRVPITLGANRDEGWTFVNRSFPAAVTPEQDEAAVDTEFGADAAKILAAYPVAKFASPKHALARLAGDVEYVCEARRVARLIAKTTAPVFLYSFEYEVDPVLPGLVAHGFEVNFVFGNNFGPPLFAAYVLDAADLALAQAMGGYWTRFASTGNPNAHGRDVVRWPEFERSRDHKQARGNKHSKDHGHERGNYIVFGTETNVASHFGGGRCRVWDRSFFRSVTGAVPAATP